MIRSFKVFLSLILLCAFVGASPDAPPISENGLASESALSNDTSTPVSIPYREALSNLNDGQNLVLPLFSQRSSYQARIDLALTPDNKQMDVLTFTLAEDSVGFSLLAAALEVVEKGGRPRIGFDAFSSKVSPELHAYMREKGIDLRSYRPLKSTLKSFKMWMKLLLPSNMAAFLNMRTHDKVFITKHGVVLGSSNYSKYYYILGKKDTPDKKERHEMWSFLDREILVQGPGELEAREEFEGKWKATDFWSEGEKVELTDEIRAKYDALINKQREFIKSVHGSKDLGNFVKADGLDYVTDVMLKNKKKKNIHHQLMEMLRSAQNEIVIENPYVLLTDDVYKLLLEKRKQGVRIKIYTNKAGGSDEGDVGQQFKLDMRNLENAGFEVMLNESFYIFHGKVVVVDNKKIYWGSYNFDPRSRNFNSENGIFFESEQVANMIKRRTASGIFVPVDIVGQGNKSYKVIYHEKSCKAFYGAKKTETIHLPQGWREKVMMWIKKPLL